jgi:hypothetical protein
MQSPLSQPLVLERVRSAADLRGLSNDDMSWMHTKARTLLSIAAPDQQRALTRLLQCVRSTLGRPSTLLPCWMLRIMFCFRPVDCMIQRKLAQTCLNSCLTFALLWLGPWSGPRMFCSTDMEGHHIKHRFHLVS